MVRNSRKSPIRIFVLLGLALVFSAESHATHCYGTITALYVDSGSRVFIRPTFRNDWIQICNSLSTWNGIDPGTCKVWISLATTLRVTQEQAVVYYQSESIVCSSIPTYEGSPAPSYLMYYTP